MVRLVALDCPSCGARLSLPEGQKEARCDYCKSVFRLADAPRTRPPTPAAPPPSASPARRSRVGLVLSLFMLLMAGGGAAAWLLLRPPSPAPTPTAPATVAPAPVGGAAARVVDPAPMVAGNRQPLLHDVNGDGTLDAIVWVQYPRDDLREHLAAYDPLTGERLWQSVALGDSSQEMWRIESYLVGERVLLSDPGGGLRALSAKTGEDVWRAPMSERVKLVCGSDEDGTVDVVLADERTLRVTLATGAFAPADEKRDRRSCPYVWSATNGERPDTPIDRWRRSPLREPAIDGMSVDHSLLDLASDRAYALGTRKPGTAVPTVAAYDRDARERRRRRRPNVRVAAHWVRAVPGGDPLKVRDRAPETAALASGRLFVPYEMAEDGAGWRVVAIDAASGETIWDEPLAGIDDDDVQTIVASDRHVFVTHWKAMTILAAATGAQLHRIEQDRSW